MLTEGFQPAEMVEPAARKTCTGTKRQIDIGRIGRLASDPRAKQRDCLDTARTELSLMAPQDGD